jgi:hypothetical protein
VKGRGPGCIPAQWREYCWNPRVSCGVSQFEVGAGLERFLGRTDAALVGPSRLSSALSASGRVRIKGVLGKGNERVGQVGTGSRVGGAAMYRAALVCMERTSRQFGSQVEVK